MTTNNFHFLANILFDIYTLTFLLFEAKNATVINTFSSFTIFIIHFVPSDKIHNIWK